LRQNLQPGRMTLVSLACGLMLAACGSGGSGGNSEGRLQVINFAYPGGDTLLTPPKTLTATATSGLPVTFSSGTPATCTVSGNQMTLVSAGECRIVASQPGGTSADGTKWAAADDTSQLFNVIKHPQTVAIVGPEYVFKAATSSVTLSTITDSGLPVDLTGGTPGVCTLSGSTLTILGKGSCAVTATQPGDANYSSATTSAFIAVDPLLVADGITGAGQGSTSNAKTAQDGSVTANPWSNLVNNGWEWCGATDGSCFTTVSPDGHTFTSALHISNTVWKATGWHYDFNRLEIFAPGLSGFNGSGDTTGGLQVTTETTLAFTLGMNDELFKAQKPVVVHLDLGKRNGGCNVTVSTLLWAPATGVVGYGIPLSNFAVTESCGLPGVTAASVDNDIRKLPNPYVSGGAAAFQAGLDAIKPARDSAAALIQSSNVVRVRYYLMDVNLDFTSSDKDTLPSDLSIVGSIRLQ
jgi:hypothetical protein